jgi:hypothetical protein
MKHYFLSLVAGGLLAVFTTPALADHREHGHHDDSHHHHGYWGGYRGYYRPGYPGGYYQSYFYSPSPVYQSYYYAPSPAYYYPPPVVDYSYGYPGWGVGVQSPRFSIWLGR